MILDRLSNADYYRPLGPRIALAFDYLRNTRFSDVADGRDPLDGNDVFAIVSRYRLKPVAEAAWEAHRRYLDVQFMVEGSEWMGYVPLSDELAVARAYDEQKDTIFYHALGHFFRVPPGSFAIFTPNDVHAPAIALSEDDASEVCKVVVKCLMM